MTRLTDLKGRIETIRELEGGSKVLWYVTKGDADPQALVQEIEAEYGETFLPEQVEHTHMRNVPSGIPGAMCIYRSAPGKGAYEVTLLDAARYRGDR